MHRMRYLGCLALLLTGSALAQVAPGGQAQSQAPNPVTQPQAPPSGQVEAGAQEAAPETQSLHILEGRSVVINLQARLRRVMISNPAILQTLTTSPTQVVVTAKAPGSTSLVLWDETGHARILDVYSDVDVSNLRDALQTAFPKEHVQVEAQQDKIVLSGNVTDSAVADEMVKTAQAFSKNVVNLLIPGPTPHMKQIMLKVRFAEVDRNKLQAFGINLFSTGAARTPGAISTGQFSPPVSQGSVSGSFPPAAGLPPGTKVTSSFTVSDLLNIFIFRPDLNLGATIRDLETNSVLQILAEPNLMAMSGQPARFLAGGEFPFPVVQGGTNVTAVTIQFRPFGVRLEFTGTIQPDNTIRLKVSPEVSTLDFANGLNVSGFTVPAMSTRRAETEIELKDGQSFGMAGLLDQRTTAQFNKVPGIGDIPILGQLFRSRQVTRAHTELLVMVTPTIVDPLAAAVAGPEQPKEVLPNLNREKFDRQIPGAKQEPAKEAPKP